MKRITKAVVALVLALVMAVTPMVVLAAPQNENVVAVAATDATADFTELFDFLQSILGEMRPVPALTPEATEMVLYDLDYLLDMLLDVLPTQNIVYRRFGFTLEDYFGFLSGLVENNTPMLSVLSAVDAERWGEAPTEDRYIAADFMQTILLFFELDFGGLGHMMSQPLMMVEQMLTQTTIIAQFESILDVLSEEELEFYLGLGYTVEEIEEYLEAVIGASLNFARLRHQLYTHPSALWFYGLNPDEIDLDIDLGEFLGTMNEDNITTAIIEEGYIAYFRIASFLNNMLLDIETLFPFFEEIQDFEHLIIDIRGNGGGWNTYFNNLVVSMLIDEPIYFRSYEFFIASERTVDFFNPPMSMLGGTLYDIVPATQLAQAAGMTGFAPEDLALLDYAIIWYTVVWPAYDNTPFDGKIWLLVDGGSASASDNAALLSVASGFATVVGEPTAGVTGVIYTYAALPNTGILFRMDIGYTVDPYGRSIEEFGVIPHYLNRPGLDALQTVVAIIRNQAPVPRILPLPGESVAAQVVAPAPTFITVDGTEFVWIRHIANVHGYTVEWNGYNYTVTVIATDGTYNIVAVSENGVIKMYNRVFIPYQLANEMFTSEIVGTWAWDVVPEWQFTFNNDGTGVRGMGAEIETFTWNVNGSDLDITITSTPITFGLPYELWSVVIDGDMLVLVSRQEAGVSFTYYRV